MVHTVNYFVLFSLLYITADWKRKEKESNSVENGTHQLMRLRPSRRSCLPACLPAVWEKGNKRKGACCASVKCIHRFEFFYRTTHTHTDIDRAEGERERKRGVCCWLCDLDQDCALRKQDTVSRGIRQSSDIQFLPQAASSSLKQHWLRQLPLDSQTTVQYSTVHALSLF